MSSTRDSHTRGAKMTTTMRTARNPSPWRRRRRRYAVAVALFLLTNGHSTAGFCPPRSIAPRPVVAARSLKSDTGDNLNLDAMATSNNSEASDQHEEIYDAIIIGSGMSGLVASNHLARKGRNVLLVEAQSIPGGYTTNFYRKGFRFEVSTHMINGCNPEGTVGRILNDLDLSDSVDFIPLKTMLRWKDPARNIDTVLPFGIEAYVSKLVSLYPHEEAGIRKFHELYYPVAEFVVEYEKRRGLNQMVYVLTQLPVLFRLLSLRRKTAADILDPLITDPACREVMTVMTALFGLHYTELDAAIFVMGSMMFHTPGGAYYPMGGSGKLSKVLANRCTEYGGRLLLKTHVDELKFDDTGMVTGVRMTDKRGEKHVEARARCVINCSDLITLVDKLCPPGSLPDDYIRSVEKRTPGNSLVVAWAGLDVDLRRDYGIKDFEIIKTNNKSSETKNIMDDVMATADYSNLPVSGATIYSNIDPSCCPKGKSVISTNFMASYDVFARTLGPRGDTRNSNAYHSLKDKVQEQLIDQMAMAVDIPDLAEHIEAISVATPITFNRYTDNFAGSFMGWRLTPKWGAFSPISNKLPVQNLFTCGQWLGVGGIASVMENGWQTAKLADRYLQKLDEQEAAVKKSGGAEGDLSFGY